MTEHAQIQSRPRFGLNLEPYRTTCIGGSIKDRIVQIGNDQRQQAAKLTDEKKSLGT
jgi:hypothetical protein